MLDKDLLDDFVFTLIALTIALITIAQKLDVNYTHFTRSNSLGTTYSTRRKRTKYNRVNLCVYLKVKHKLSFFYRITEI